MAGSIFDPGRSPGMKKAGTKGKKKGRERRERKKEEKEEGESNYY